MVKRRDNFIEFIYYNLQNIKDQIFPLLGLVISLVGAKNHYVPYIKIGFYLLISFIVIYSFLKWYNKFFEFNDEMIRISEGVFKKRKNDIPYNRVKSINTSASLLKRLFGISNFSVELIGGKKVFFVLKNIEIDVLKEQLFSNIHTNNKNSNGNKLKPFEYFLLSLTNYRVFLTSLSLSLTIYSFVINYLSKKAGIKNKDTEKNGKELFESLKQIDILDTDFLVSILIFLVVISTISYLISFVYIHLTYSNFNTSSNEKDIHINYGILNKKSYHIPKNQIRSLRVTEPLLFRFFGFVQLKVDNIGLNEQNSSSILLHPVIRKDRIKHILDKHIPNFDFPEIDHRPEKDTLIHFLIWPISKLLGIILALLFFSPKWIFLLVLLPFPIIFGCIKWKHSGISICNDFATIKKTSGFKTTTVVTLKKYTETTRTKQSIFMKKHDIHHYRIAVYSEKQTETYECKFVKTMDKQFFLNYLTP